MLKAIFEVFLLTNLAFVVCTAGCPSDWTNTDGICYKVFEGQNRDWDSAQGVCVALGGYLAEIPNYFVQKTIATGVTGNCWIGLRSNGTGEYSWRSGRELNEFQFWKDGEPGSHECVSFSGTQSEWETKGCNDMINCFICMAGSLPDLQIGCNFGEVIEGRCYRAIDHEVTWETALWQCEMFGSDLAEISNENLNYKLITYLSGKAEPNYWIGLRRNATTGLYEWRSGRALNDSFVTWKDGNDPASNTGNTQNCAEIHGADWELKECDRNRPYLCQSGQLSYPTVCSNTVLSNGLDTGGICYSISDSRATWYDANATCAGNGGRLARILNRQSVREIQRMTNNGEDYWIGLKRDENTGQFQWTDGTSLTFNGWSDGIPMQGYGCVGVHGNSTNWVSLDCNSSNRFICETDVCDGWTVRNGICYRKFEQTNMKWLEAVDLCEEENGYIAEIPNIYVNNIITDLLGIGIRCWIGLTKFQNIDYSWRIGNFSLGDVETTGVNSGDGVIGNENQNSIEKGWKTQSNSKYFSCTVCMKGPLTEEAPTEICTELTTDITIDRGYCYRRIKDTPRNLVAASLTCNSYNGALYTFNDARVNVRLYSNFKSSRRSFWLQDPLQYNLFVPHGDYFNLITDRVAYNNNNNANNAECKILTEDGNTVGEMGVGSGSDSGCEDNSVDGDGDCLNCDVNYICRIDYVPDENILKNVSTNDRCYWSVSGNRKWTEAETQCVTEGGHLVEIFNGDTQNIIVSLIATGLYYLDELYWIGIGEHLDSSSQWRSGANINYNNFSSNSMIESNHNLSCVAIDKYGSWIAQECNNKLSFICGKTVTNGNYSPCSCSPTLYQTIAASFAPIDVCSGWRVRNGICYKKFETETNWEGAVEQCKAENAYIAEIPNIYVNNVLTSIIGTDECWIGLSTDCTDYSWRIGNFSLSDTNRDVVLNINDANKCGTIGVNNGHRWSLKDCNTPQTCTVCMKGPLTIEYPINVCDGVRDGIILVDRGSCYRSNARRADELDLAILRCNRLNGDLYLFDNEEFNNRLIGIYNSFYYSPVYPKEFVNEYNQFTPQDGYFNLLTSNENITSPVMCQNVSNGELTETDCINNINFICKIEYEPAEMTLRNDSTQDMHYWSVSGNRNWTEAETQCVTKGGHLVEIFNGDTQNITVSLIATELYYLNELYWIGIGEYVDSSSQWRSGANINYSNFSDQIITTQLSCVAIDKYGSWIVSDCGNRYSFVCGPTTNTTSAKPTATTNSLIQINENRTSNCSMPDVDLNTLCISLLLGVEAQNDTAGGESLLIQREEYLENLLLVVNVSTRITIKLFISPHLVLVITRIGLDVDTNISIGRNSIQIDSDSFLVETTILILADLNYAETSQKLLSDVITIIASNQLIGKITIMFQIGNTKKLEENGDVKCVFLTNNKDELWSSEGITTEIGVNGAVGCVTEHLTTFAVLFLPFKFCARDNNGVGRQILIATSYTLLAISLLFLLASLFIFSFSGKRFFLADINISHFNHAISLFLAVGSFISLVQSVTHVSWLCTAAAFLLHFLWTNVFVSSLSIAILVFYSIWIVSIKHTARKLSKYMISIGWSVSLLWALVWLIYGKLTGEYLQVDSRNVSIEDDCEYSCFLSTENYLVMSFLIPIYVILVLNGSILIVSLFRIRLALKSKHKFESELTTLRRVSIGAILLIPALSLPFILAIPLSFSGLIGESAVTVFEWAYILSNAPIGIIHFLLITYQIPEAYFPKWFCSKLSQQPTTFSVTESNNCSMVRKLPIHFNVVRANHSSITESTVYGNDWVETRL